MTLNITRGKQRAPVRLIAYGVEGIGKTSLFQSLDNALYIDTEDGSKELDVSRVLALDWQTIESTVRALIVDQQGFTSIIFDTADWLEKSLIEHLSARFKDQGIEKWGGGFGKGYIILAEHFGKFLALCDRLISKGVHVVFIAHSTVKRVSPPDQTDGYDRYEMKLTKTVGPLLREWSDMILFCNYKLQIVEGSDGRLKAQGGKERIMNTERSAAWDAKNRYSLAPELKMEFGEIAHVFANAVPRAIAAPTLPAPQAEAESSAPSIPDPEPGTPADEPQPIAASEEQIAKLVLYVQNSTGKPMVDKALESAGCVAVDELSAEQADALIVAIQNAMNAPEPKKSPAKPAGTPSVQVPSNTAAWLNQNFARVNEYLVTVKWLQPGQQWHQLAAEKLHTIVDRADKFAQAAGIKPMGAK